MVIFYSLIATDIGLGVLALFYRHLFTWLAMLSVTLGYTLIISIYTPLLWLDPISSLPKNIPIISWLLVLILLELDSKKLIHSKQGNVS
jgi:hypothetical protein